MKKEKLAKTAQSLVADGKGLLAADESFPTIKKRFEKIGIESTEENRRAYRELLFTSPGIEEFISGVIMFDETIHQATKDGLPFPKLLSDRGIIPGIKVDEGKDPFPGSPKEYITKGLEGLDKRLEEYKILGARFTKWRALIVIGDNLPTDKAIIENSRALAECALVSQELGFVPIVEPEVLMEGNHDISRCGGVTRKTLISVFSEMEKKKVYLPGTLLKPNMIVSGKESGKKASSEEVAKATLRVFARVVPEEIPGIVFLSGGQSPEEATANLKAINKRDDAPWELSFSFGRALQQPALKAWKGKEKNVTMAQEAFLKRARLNSLARYGKHE